jgi:hypothetical protein|tara:strand:- start:312 stop:1124 length:813 start_codon:yes stop_codon:yes gene_type:complete
MNNGGLWSETSIKTRIINKYYTLVDDFLIQLETILVSVPELNISVCTFVGLNSINRVFEYVLFKTKNIEKAYYYAQKTFFYYIEYMEQVHKSNLQNSLNQSDAVLFIYNKTIFELQNGNDSKLFDTITNIMTFDEEISNLHTRDYREWFSSLSKMVNTLFYWGNMNFTFKERLQLSKRVLKPYMRLSGSYESPISYIEMLQDKIELHYDTYMQILQEILEYNKTMKLAEYKTIEQNEVFLLKFYIEKKTIYKNIEENNIKGLVKWLYEPI